MIRWRRYAFLTLGVLASSGCSAFKFSLVPTLDPSRPVGLNEVATVVQVRDRVREVTLADGQRLQLVPIVVRRVTRTGWGDIAFRLQQDQEPFENCECAAVGAAEFEVEPWPSPDRYVVPREAVNQFRDKDWVWQAESPDEDSLSEDVIDAGARRLAEISDSTFVMGINSIVTRRGRGGPGLVDLVFAGNVWRAEWAFGVDVAPPPADRAVRLGTLRAKGVDSVKIADAWYALADDSQWFERPWGGSIKFTNAGTEELVGLVRSARNWSDVRSRDSAFFKRIRRQNEARVLLVCRTEDPAGIPLRPGQAATLQIGPKEPDPDARGSAYYPFTLDRRNGFFGVLIGVGAVLVFLVYSTS